MNPVNDKIVVRSNLAQKDFVVIDGIEFKMANLFEVNYREKSPVLAEVVHGNEYLVSGDIVVCHHNTFYEPSPYFLYDDLFSIPANGNILFFSIDKNGELKSLYGNIVCQRIVIDSYLPLPPEQQKTFTTKSLVKEGGSTRYKQGQTIFHRPHAAYDVVYIYNGIEKRVTKVAEFQVCGYLK
jgi:hypothetical protein